MCWKPHCRQEVSALHLIKRRALMKPNRALRQYGTNSPIRKHKPHPPWLGNSKLLTSRSAWCSRTHQFIILQLDASSLGSWDFHSVFKNLCWSLERRLSGSDQVSLLQRTCIWFPVPMPSSSQLPALPTLRAPTPSSSFHKCLYSCAHPLKYN